MPEKRLFFILLLLSAGFIFLSNRPKRIAKVQADVIYVGLRRSHYGLREKNADNRWWVERAKNFASLVKKNRPTIPTIIEIISGYKKNGTTLFTFSKPSAYRGDTGFMIFKPGKLNHERALSLYDQQGVKAIIQLEPGEANVLSCLEIADQAFGHHPCIIGYGVDAEWFRTDQSADRSGIPVSDSLAALWLKKIRSFDASYSLFLKHWDIGHLPAHFRHPKLWFLDDSQGFRDLSHFIREFKDWAAFAPQQYAGYQFGYPRDRVWWNTFKNPPLTLSKALIENIAQTKFLFWVDFTADQIPFKVSD